MEKKTYLIACGVLAVDLKDAAKKLGITLETRFLEAGLHNNPQGLKSRLQAAIDDISARRDGDRIIIGYGVCGKGTIGIRSRNLPLVIPKVHDCIALFLGGDQAYKEEFKKYPGTYYLSAGWCRENAEPMSQRRQQAWFGSEKLEFKDLVNSHGKEAAHTTFEFLNSWQKNYQRAVFIETGAGGTARYEARAKEMAREYNWDYARIKGGHGLIEKLLGADRQSGEILFVPPDHIIGFDGITASLSANPVLTGGTPPSPDPGPDKGRKIHAPGAAPPLIRLGLGIDAGGTYTDAVIYDLKDRTTVAKAKALTTKWNFTLGIGRALDKLDRERLVSVELAALSTTLATNAIVENQGQKVGMLLMPPFGLAQDIDHEPCAVIQGRLDISGKERVPLDPEQIRQVAENMLKKRHVTAFAVSGYAGAVNPVHELEVKKILEDHTGLFVSCGHELSHTLNFKTRAITAMLNARIIPRLTCLLADLKKVMAAFGIKAPIVVVKGDGTLMGAAMARQRPVETILSGPAASVAGARHLTGIQDALVVDMGGTTTDTAALMDNQVSLKESGSHVGGFRTHVKALAIRTTGLGGDSLICLEAGKFLMGPRRVAPMAWLGLHHQGVDKSMGFLADHLDRYGASTEKMQIIARTGAGKPRDLTGLEQKVLDHLSQRPLSIDELIDKTGVLTHSSLPLERLEEKFLIQRCGLTLTDLLHVTGQFVQWDRDTARHFAALFSQLWGKDIDLMIKDLIRTGVSRLALELIKQRLSQQVDPGPMDSCPVCRALTDSLLAGGGDHLGVSMDLKQPIIGIGAPIKFFLPGAAKILNTRAVLPQDGDVANAIGAITSHVSVKKQLRIIPGDQGGFAVEGIAGNPKFREIQEADDFTRKELTRMIRDQARAAGSSATRVEIIARDRISKTASGDPVFMDRTLEGSLTGQPDLVMGQKETPPVQVQAVPGGTPKHKR